MMGVMHSLCNYATHTGQRQSYLDSLCSREPIQNVIHFCVLYKYVLCRSRLYNPETDNNDNSSR